jgi:hypothetical protein
VDDNRGSRIGYEPNSYGEWEEQPEFREPPLALDGAADRNCRKAAPACGAGVTGALGIPIEEVPE